MGWWNADFGDDTVAGGRDAKGAGDGEGGGFEEGWKGEDGDGEVNRQRGAIPHLSDDNTVAKMGTRLFLLISGVKLWGGIPPP